jgi:selenide, water dikinase
MNTADDAGVYRLSPELALVQTVDIITPVVDDAYTFGAVAAANSVSDVYAMGGRPVCALNVACFPRGCLPLEVLHAILSGAAEKLAEARVPIIGGHTIDDQEPKFGLAVTGTVHPERIWTNAGAQPGDCLVLTKPLGVGVITTAAKNDKAAHSVLEGAIASMITLNRLAAEVAATVTVHACTDVTGFGLLGHLREIAQASGVSATVWASSVPLLAGARELAEEDLFPGGAYRNRESLEGIAHWQAGFSQAEELLLCDPQTSGGLLLSLPPAGLDALLEGLSERGIRAARVGEVTDRSAGAITVRP